MIGDWGAGATPTRSCSQYYNGTIPWLKTGELNNDYVYDSEEHITEKALQECSLRYNSKGDILIAMYGATIGKLAIAGTDLTTNQACCACTPFTGIYNIYLFYYLMSHKNNFIKIGEGGAQPNISREKIIKELIPIPPLAEQNRIVSKIEELFAQVDKIEEEKQSLLKLIDKAKDKVLDLAMKGKLVKQDPNDEPASVLLEKIFEEKKKLAKEGKIKLSKDELLEPKPCVDNDYYQDLPKCWIKIKLQKIAKIISKGTTPRDKNCYTDNGIGFLRIENLTSDFGIDKSSIKYVTKETNDGFLNRSILEANDILITIAGTLGKMAIINERDLPLNTNQAICFIRLINNNFTIPKYVLYFLQSNTINKELKRQAKVTAIPNLTLEMIKDTEISIPPVLEQKLIIEQIDFYLDRLDKIKDSL